MKEFTLETWNDDGHMCTFYSVKFVDEEESETDKFLEKFFNQTAYKENVQILVNYLNDPIGNKYGAIDDFFNRDENVISGLPHHGRVRTLYFPNFPLRLFAYRITDEIVVLLSGGLKTNKTNQDSELSKNWYLSCEFGRKIQDAIKDGTILVDTEKRKLFYFNGHSEIVLS